MLSAILKHSLAQRSDEQVSAYLKGAGLELLAYAGLCWFLVGLNGNGIYGAIAYLIGMTGARKQRDAYYQEPGQEEEAGGSDAPEADTGSQEVLPSAQEISDSAESEPGVLPSAESEPGALPSAADRLLREKESEDGSV